MIVYHVWTPKTWTVKVGPKFHPWNVTFFSDWWLPVVPMGGWSLSLAGGWSSYIILEQPTTTTLQDTFLFPLGNSRDLFPGGALATLLGSLSLVKYEFASYWFSVLPFQLKSNSKHSWLLVMSVLFSKYLCSETLEK